jgi:calcineurin-like phosphoesterase family protein
MKDCGFIIVEGIIQIKNLLLTHRPLLPEQIPEGFVNIHGHIHEKDSLYGINVSVEKTNYSKRH